MDIIWTLDYRWPFLLGFFSLGGFLGSCRGRGERLRILLFSLSLILFSLSLISAREGGVLPLSAFLAAEGAVPVLALLSLAGAAAVFRPRVTALPLLLVLFLYVWGSGLLTEDLIPLPEDRAAVWEGAALPVGQRASGGLELTLYPPAEEGGRILELSGAEGERFPEVYRVWQARPWCVWLASCRWLEWRPRGEPAGSVPGRGLWFLPKAADGLRGFRTALYPYLHYRMTFPAGHGGEPRLESGFCLPGKEE